MKKLAVIASVFMLASGLSMAQKRPLTIPVQSYPDAYMNSISQPAALGSDRPDNGIRPNSSASVNTRGGAIWSEDFGNGFPAGWAVDDLSGISPWKWTTEGSHGYWNGTNGNGYGAAINSTTASNGFLINDPDSANHFTYGQPSGTTYQYLESYFATNAIDLGASYSSLLLEFEQAFRFNNSVDMIVQVSPDSTNWTEFTVQGATGNNTASPDPDQVSLNISGAIGASQTVYLRIGWSSRVYFWMIDDMRIIQGLDNDIALTKAYHGDIILDYQYSKYPLEQTTEMVLGAVVSNFGGNVQTNVTIDYDILRNGTSVSTGSFSLPDDLDPAEVDTAWYSTGYTPDQTGDYEVTMTVSSDITDENTSNQSGSSEFEVTDFTFAHDYDDAFDVQVWGQATNGVANPYSHGNVFIPYNAGSSIYAMDVAFGSLTSSGTSVIAQVLELGSSIQDVVDSYESVFDIYPEHINGGSNFFFTTIVLEDEVALNAGTGYTIAVQSEGGADSLYVLGNTGDEDFSTTLYGPYGTGAAVNWYNGWNHTPGIRMNLNPDIAGVDDIVGSNNVLVYPNPSTDVINVLLDKSKYTAASVTDVTGRLVLDLSAELLGTGNRFTFDVSNMVSGIYLLNLQGEASSTVKRISVN